MQMQNPDIAAAKIQTNEHYTAVAILLHWTISTCFLSALALGIASKYLPESTMSTVFFLHKSFGLTVLFLMLIRIMWRLTHKPPAFPNTMPTWMKQSAKLSHFCLYLVALLMPLTGLLMSSAGNHFSSFWGLFAIKLPIQSKALGSFMNSAHYYIAWIIGGLVILHIGAVIKHQLIDKDRILDRMTKLK